MANLITALQLKPSVSSANYVAEFWCLNHYDMLGTGRERTVRTWSPKARSWLGFQSIEGQLGLAALGGARGTPSPNSVFRRSRQTRKYVNPILNFFKAEVFQLSGVGTYSSPLPDLLCFSDKLGPSQPQKKKKKLYKPRAPWCWLSLPSSNVRPAEARLNFKGTRSWVVRGLMAVWKYAHHCFAKTPDDYNY